MQLKPCKPSGIVIQEINTKNLENDESLTYSNNTLVALNECNWTNSSIKESTFAIINGKRHLISFLYYA